MADLRDEYGNPIQLTDELGNPVQLTDECGNPMHLTGVARTKDAAAASQVHGVGIGFPPAAAHVPAGYDVGAQAQLSTEEGHHEHRELKQELEHDRQRQQHVGAEEAMQRSRSSSSSSVRHIYPMLLLIHQSLSCN